MFMLCIHVCICVRVCVWVGGWVRVRAHMLCVYEAINNKVRDHELGRGSGMELDGKWE